jgi:hypothetical protein
MVQTQPQLPIPTTPPTPSVSPIPARTPDSQLLASAVLGLGSGVWKAISAWSNVDFLLSIREERFAVMFEFFQNTGWIILLIIGVIWGVIRLSSKKKKPLPDWSLLASTSIITFMFGVLIAVRASSGFPQIITGYGVEAPNCGANVTTTRLRSFRDEYRIGLVCGFGDPSRDQLDDDRVTVSNLFHISQGSFSIIAPYSDRMRADPGSWDSP